MTTTRIVRFGAVACSLAALALAAVAAPLAAGPINLSLFATCAKSQSPTPAKPCKPTAATKIDYAKFSTCASRVTATRMKPCKKKTSSSSGKSVAIPICEYGQKSTSSLPCISLGDNGPPPTTKSSTSTGTKTPTPTPAVVTPKIITGVRINSHLCQANDGTIFECGQVDGYDPGKEYPPGQTYAPN